MVRFHSSFLRPRTGHLSLLWRAFLRHSLYLSNRKAIWTGKGNFTWCEVLIAWGPCLRSSHSAPIKVSPILPNAFHIWVKSLFQNPWEWIKEKNTFSRWRNWLFTFKELSLSGWKPLQRSRLPSVELPSGVLLSQKRFHSFFWSLCSRARGLGSRLGWGWLLAYTSLFRDWLGLPLAELGE